MTLPNWEIESPSTRKRDWRIIVTPYRRYYRPLSLPRYCLPSSNVRPTKQVRYDFHGSTFPKPVNLFRTSERTDDRYPLPPQNSATQRTVVSGSDVRRLTYGYRHLWTFSRTTMHGYDAGRNVRPLPTWPVTNAPFPSVKFPTFSFCDCIGETALH